MFYLSICKLKLSCALYFSEHLAKKLKDTLIDGKTYWIVVLRWILKIYQKMHFYFEYSFIAKTCIDNIKIIAFKRNIIV